MNGIPRRTLRAAALLFLLLCSGWYVRDSFLAQVPDASLSDFRWYYLAAQHVLHGESPYLAAGFLYPPLLACAFMPLALLDYVPARWAWFLISHLCLLAAARITWRHLGRDWLAACAVAFVWALGGAAGESLALGQTGPLLTLLLAIAYTRAGRLRGALVAAGFAIKLLPGVLSVPIALQRDWRAWRAALVCAAFLLAVPWVIVARLAGPKAPAHRDYLAGTPAVLNWSLPAVALRIYEPPRPHGPLPNTWIAGNTLEALQLSRRQRFLSASVALAALAAGFAILAAAVRGRLSSAQMPMACAATVALTLAAAPVCWTHYQVMQYPGVALLLGYAARNRRRRLLAAALICAAFLYPVPVAVLRACYQQNGAWPNAPATMYSWTSVSPVASLALFGLMVRQLRSRSRSR
jgi:hypothetical protein